jgi:hypothetical protein
MLVTCYRILYPLSIMCTYICLLSSCTLMPPVLLSLLLALVVSIIYRSKCRTKLRIRLGQLALIIFNSPNSSRKAFAYPPIKLSQSD